MDRNQKDPDVDVFHLDDKQALVDNRVKQMEVPELEIQCPGVQTLHQKPHPAVAAVNLMHSTRPTVKYHLEIMGMLQESKLATSLSE